MLIPCSLAIEYALETTTVSDVPLDVKKYEIPTNANPYILPWIMRGLLEEDFVKTELNHETTELLKEFDDVSTKFFILYLHYSLQMLCLSCRTNFIFPQDTIANFPVKALLTPYSGNQALKCSKM